MVRGRKPKPAAIKRLEGNPGKRALGADLPAELVTDVSEAIAIS